MANFLPDKDIAETVYRDVEWARNYRQEYRDRWEGFYALYRNYLDRANYPWESNLAIPSAFSVVEVQVAFLTDMIFEGGNFVEVLGKTPQGQVSAEAVQKMLNYHFINSFRTYEEFEKYIRQLVIFGTSVFKTYWNYEPGWKTRMVPEYENNELKKYRSVLSPEILHNAPDGYTVDLFNFGIDPNAPDCLGARFAFEEMWVDPIKLIEKQQIGIYKNVPEAIGQSTKTNEGLQMRLDKVEIPAFQDAPEVERGKIHVIDYWGYVTKGWKQGKLSKQAKTQLYHVVLALNSSSRAGEGLPTVLLAEPSPFHHNRIPFVDSGLNRCVGEFYGKGDIEYCESLFLEERDLRNIQLDNLTRTMNKMFLVNRNADIDEGELVWRPTGIIHVDSVKDDVGILDSAPIDPASFKTQDDIRRDIEMVTGVNDFVMGQYRSSTGFNDTATGISLIQQVALKRIGHKGQIVQRAIRDIAQMTFTLVAQYQPWGTTVRILDKNSATRYRFIDISPQALSQMYDFQIVSAPALGSKPLRQNQLIQIFQLLIQFQGVAQQQGLPMDKLDLNIFARRLLEEMDLPNPDEFFGFQSFNQPLDERVGQPGSGEVSELISPEEENRLMIEQHMMVYPKLEENHPQHKIVHSEAYDMVDDPEAKQLLQEHDKLHTQLMETSKDLIATTMTTQATSDMVNQQLNMIQGGGKQQSPTGAGGAEDGSRSMGNLLAGNV